MKFSLNLPKGLLVFGVLLMLSQSIFAQSIGGNSCVLPGSTNTYTINSGYHLNGTTVTWCISGGTIVGASTCKGGTFSSNMSIDVIWSSSGGSLSLYTNSGSFYKSVSVATALQPGAITSTTSQNIQYNSYPAAITCSPASGGACSGTSNTYHYSWQQSTDGVNWTYLPGAGTQDLTSFAAPLTQTTYFRREVTATATNSSMTSNIATVYVAPPPPFSAGSLTSPVSGTITYNTSPGIISGSLPTWGNCSGSYTYQWEASANGGQYYIPISGATGQNYAPSNLTVSTLFRRKDKCGSEELFTNTVLIEVAAQLSAGTLSPTNLTIPTNTSPGTITGSAASGGNCGSYQYSWEYSYDNISFTALGVATQNYTPPAINSRTYYRRKVTCGTETFYSNVVTILIQLQAGATNGGTTPIFQGASAGTLSCTPAYGNCGTNYQYQWYQSTDGVNYVLINGATSSNYAPGNLSATTYFKCRVTCGSEQVYSTAKQIQVYPHLVAGSITTLPLSLPYNTNPGTINATASSGGNCSSYTYVWQSSSNNSTWTDLASGTTQNYSFPTGLTQSRYYRRKTICGPETLYTNVIAINIAFNAGQLSSSQAIEQGGVISPLTVNNIGGGEFGATYAYQWQSSADEINWTAISGAAGNSFTPTMTAVTTYYRVKVSTAQVSSYTNTVAIRVVPVATTNIPVTTTQSSNQPAVAMPAYPTGTNALNLNFVRVRTFVKPGITDMATALSQQDKLDVSQTTQFFDGLGKPIQTVTRWATPSGKDLIAPVFYDAYGRVEQQFLPYSDQLETGNFRLDAATKQPSFFNAHYTNSENFYYSNNTYEASPLNRLLKQTAPGKSWTGSNRGVRMQERTNRKEEDVKMWSIAAALGSVPSVTGIYDKGTLYVSETTDENENKVIEYKNKEGQVILKKVQVSPLLQEGHAGWLSTYYVYDVFSRLRWVLQPKAVEWLQANNWNLANNSTLQSEMCFRYEYDKRGRMVIKKVPGAGEVWMVYDQRDRLIMTQDDHLRSSTTKKWLVTEYDQQNRPIRTGLLTNAGVRTYHEEQAANTFPYPNVASGYEVLSSTFYDDYSYSGVKSYDANISFDAGVNRYPVVNQKSEMTRGMVTGSKIKVLGSSQELLTTTYYDHKGRVIQVLSDNILNGTELLANQYDFSGKVLSNVVRHQKSAGGTVSTILTKLQYDHTGKVVNIKKKVNGNAEKLLVQMNYNDLGELKTKQLGQKADLSFLETQDYEYSIRGWLKSLNKDFAVSSGTNANNRYFGMELSYDFGFVKNQLNGNIAGVKWRSKGDGEQRAFGYDYDLANRLLKGDFTQNNGGWNTSAGMDFSVSGLTYDANGNILSQDQKGWKITGSGYIDQLRYTYATSTNKLQNVVDLSNDPSTKMGDFRTSALHPQKTSKDSYVQSSGSVNLTSITDYTYDGNGNLVLDKNKDISAITYNHLNLPSTITTNKGTITYTYDAGGNKLKKVVAETGKTAKTTLYIGGAVYEDDVLQFLGHEEGRIRWKVETNTFHWDYFLKDHLGNVRIVLTDEEQTVYYPAATMEGSLTTGDKSMLNWEKQFYTIDNSQLRARSQISSWTTSKDYQNNNGNPPYNSKASGSYPSDHTVNDVATSDRLYRVNATTNKTGLASVIKVMAGDKINIHGKSYYQSTATFNNTNSTSMVLSDILNAFLGSPGNAAVGKGLTTTDLNTLNSTLIPSDFIRGTNGESTTTPKAYINYILLDEQFKYVSGGASRVGSSGTVKSHWFSDATLQNIVAQKSGYLYVYVSNESNLDVFFDNLQIIHTKGPLLEETHYYPFGLTIAGISSKAAGGIENKRKYQQYEFNSAFDINLYESFYRSHDPQLGRFWQIDPKPTDNVSLYAAMNNNPIRYSDPLGDSIRVNLEGIHNGVFTQFAHTKEGRKFLSNYAKKGQTIAGITFKKDGKYHTKGVDLNYESAQLSIGTKGETGKSIDENGRGQITVTMDSDKSLMNKENLGNAFITMFHESFIHADLYTKDFIDNKKFDHSNIGSNIKDHLKGKGSMGANLVTHYQHHQVAYDRSNKGSGHLWPHNAYNGLIEINKAHTFWSSQSEIINKMWNYSGGL